MVFSSVHFLFVFCPLFFVVYWLGKTVPVRNGIILAGSLLFYFWGEQGYVAVMLASICITWGFGRLIDRTPPGRRRKALLIAGIGTNVALLAYFKYFYFLLTSVFPALAALVRLPVHIAVDPVHLPIGISFFTFQAISYLVDLHRGTVRCQRSLAVFGMYKAMFPQLIAGPIVRYAQIEDRIYERPFRRDEVLAGVNRFVIGFGQKMLLANPSGRVADLVFDVPLAGVSTPAAWIGAFAYAMQILFDFSGYSNMAIGLAAVMGFKFPENFDFPYTARSITEFWRRWHMTLSLWFRDYVYIPLGGNRVSQARTLLNLLVVFALCGLWHGATWVFLAWGLYHGLFLVAERLGLGRLLNCLPSVLGRVYAFAAVLIGWVIFRANSVAHASHFIKRMVGQEEPADVGAVAVVPTTLHALLTYESMLALGVGALIAFGAFRPLQSSVRRFDDSGSMASMAFGLGKSMALMTLFTVSLIYLAGASFNPFIYFRF
jgi:alginate O-acetyltransferase complex protein AlgI